MSRCMFVDLGFEMIDVSLQATKMVSQGCCHRWQLLRTYHQQSYQQDKDKFPESKIWHNFRRVVKGTRSQLERTAFQKQAIGPKGTVIYGFDGRGEGVIILKFSGQNLWFQTSFSFPPLTSNV